MDFYIWHNFTYKYNIITKDPLQLTHIDKSLFSQMISLSPLILALLFIFFKNYKAADTNLNDSPIIGIMTVPSESPHQYPPDQYSYFDASYVKILESGGARIVPV